MEKEIFEQMHRVEERHWWFVARRRIIARMIRRIGFTKDIKILDAGCGNGGNLSFLSALGHISALEKDADALARSEDQGLGQSLSGPFT